MAELIERDKKANNIELQHFYGPPLKKKSKNIEVISPPFQKDKKSNDKEAQPFRTPPPIQPPLINQTKNTKKDQNRILASLFSSDEKQVHCVDVEDLSEIKAPKRVKSPLKKKKVNRAKKYVEMCELDRTFQILVKIQPNIFPQTLSSDDPLASLFNSND